MGVKMRCEITQNTDR